MNIWNLKTTTYKTHLLSALCRSLFTNACWIFATSLFVKVVGSKGYSQLFFFASLCSLSYYLYFALRGHKEYEPYNVYRAVLVLALLASVGCFFEPHVAFLQPVNELLLYFFVVAVMTVDLVGTTLGPIVLQASVNPAIFRQVFQNIVTMELTARITAAVIVWFLSQIHQLEVLYPIAWVLLIAHFILFGMTVWRMRVSEIRAGVPRGKRPRTIENVGSSFKFMFSNPLVRVAMAVMVWATISKFVIENLFYQGADATFSSSRQIASFVSVLTIVIYTLSLCMHHPLNRIVNARMQLSTVLSLQPVNVLIFAGIALVLPPFWPLVLLMVTYNILHRSVELPMSRQCLVPVPRRQRATIVALISIVIAIATMVTSGIMAVLKNSLQMEDFLVFLLIAGSLVLFMITSLDSYYIRNLWSMFQETRSGRWQDDRQAETLTQLEQLESDSDVLVSATNTADLSFHPILQAYAFSNDKSDLYNATVSHRSLLSSSKSELLLSALRICFVADFPWFREPLLQAAGHGDSRVREFAEKALSIEREFVNMSEHSSVFRRRVRAIAMEFLDSNHSKANLAKLKRMLDASDRNAADELVAVLSETRFRNERDLVLACAVDDGTALSVQPIIDQMYKTSFAVANVYRDLLARLSFGKNSNELRMTIEANLNSLKQDKPLLKPERSEGEQKQLQIFLHTLFLDEYRLSSHADRALSNTIGDLPNFAPEETGILVDMHLSFLKRSEFYGDWAKLML